MVLEKFRYVENELKQTINDSLYFLKNLREKEGKWQDELTEDWDEKQWEKGSVIIAEALLCFLLPSTELKSRHISFSSKLSDKILDEDIQKLISFAKTGTFHARPYDGTMTSFTDTAAVLLSTFSHILSADSDVPQNIRDTYRNEIGESCNQIIDFLKKSAFHPTKGTSTWAFTHISTWRGGIGKSRALQLDSTYNTYLVLKALTDAWFLLPTLLPTEREDILKMIQEGTEGLIECYDHDLSFFSRNSVSTERGVIHSIFALEGLLYCLEKGEITEAQKNIIILCVDKIIETIGIDLNNISSYDQDITWHFAFRIGKDQQSALLEDRSTLGSIVNVLCFALRYLPPKNIEDAYKMIDSLISAIFDRKNPKTKVWVKKKFRIYYTFRMIESLTYCIRYRSEQEFTISRRELSQMLDKALSSDEVIWFITDRMVRNLRSIDLEGGE